MKPYNHLTIIRNVHRSRELRAFRDLVDVYFDRSQRDPDGVPVDWEAAQVARARINERLSRVIGMVRAAGIGGPAALNPNTDPGLPLGRVEALQHIFSSRYVDGVEQEIFDVIDMAIGVYDGDRVSALLRTLNPFHHAGTALAFVARAPRWFFTALGFSRRADAASRLRPADVARLEAAAERLAEAEEFIETRLAALQDRQAMRHAETARQVAELAERLDFAERVLAGQRPPQQLRAADESEIPTPV